MPPKPSSNWERHIQSFLLAIITALAIYVGNTVNNTAQEVVKLQAYVTRLQLDLSTLTLDFRNASDASYKAKDIDRSFDYRDQQIKDLNARVSTLEGKKR